MKRIGLLSDTHAYWDEKFREYFSECDEIWHAGDIGSEEIARRLNGIKPLRAVYGTIDSQELRLSFSKELSFTVEGVRVFMTHIGGYPGRYNPDIRKRLYEVEQLRYDRLRSSQKETARLRHDFQNYLLVLRGLLEKEHSGEEGETI